MGKPRILGINRAETADLEASAEDTGYPVENLSTWRATDVWKASDDTDYEIEIDFDGNYSINSFAIVNHNLFTEGARYKLEGIDAIDSSTPDYTLIKDWTTPGDDLTLADFFTATNYDGVRISIDNDGAPGDIEPYIGVVFIGSYLEMEVYPALGFDEDGMKDIRESSKAITGYDLGTVSEYTTRLQTWKFIHLSNTWTKDTWLPFYMIQRNKPFVWVWDYENHGDEVYLMKFNQDTSKTPRPTGLRRTLTFKLDGVLEE